jgi:L-2,4-diaminobutyrate transaminase
MLTNDQLAKWDRESFIHPSTHLAQHARGETATSDHQVRRGVFHHRPRRQPPARRLRRALLRQYRLRPSGGRRGHRRAGPELAYYHAYVGHGTEASVTLAKMVIDRAPENMSRVYFGLGGSDANETNVKLVWYYNNILGRPEKKKIISRWRGYHGSGLMTGSLTGLSSCFTRSSTCR